MLAASLSRAVRPTAAGLRGGFFARRSVPVGRPPAVVWSRHVAAAAASASANPIATFDTTMGTFQVGVGTATCPCIAT